jgi:D-alanyl-D-alanine carboxypeptidase/D-alanyl-D-alanine-endopeptidase (penicillin-binding protein 4)
MTRWVGGLVCVALALLAQVAAPGQALDVQHLRQQLDTLVAEQSPETTVGLVVEDAATGEVLYANAAHTPLKPASLLKLLVSAAAIEHFSGKFTYETNIYLHDGALYVVGSGDPGLGDERLVKRRGEPRDAPFEAWAAALRERGITALRRIVLDDTVFEAPARHPDWPDDQADRWYQAPAGGLNWNDNCLDVKVRVEDGEIRLELIPDLPERFVDSALSIGRRQRMVIRRGIDSDVFELRGTVKRGGSLRAVAVRDPTTFFGAALRRALASRGITIAEPAVRRAFEHRDGAAKLATSRTTLEEVVWRCNTHSQNMFADCLLKTLAAYRPDGRRSGKRGSWAAGRIQLRRVLHRLGLDVRGARVRDGSGLSHTNRVTPAQLAELLVRMAAHPQAALFRASLAAPGEPGSMRSRYAAPALRGRLRGKTGTISGVRCLAGYLAHPGGRELVFVIMINGPADGELPTTICKVILGKEQE